MTRTRHGWTRAGVAVSALLLASGTAWGQTFVYPQKGQSPQQQAQQAQAQQMQAAQMDTFNRAAGTCLNARGYSVN